MTQCSVNQCSKPALARRLCSKHYQQLKRTGQVRTKTEYSENPIVNHGGWVLVGLRDAYNNVVGWTKLSAEDLPLVEGKRLRAMRGKYIDFWDGSKRMLLHRAILNAPVDMQVDHINGDPLDNRRENLRLATPSQNSANYKTREYKGVRRRWRKYSARVQHGGEVKHLGMFSTAEEAARAYDRAAFEIWGEYARLNFPHS